MIAYAVLRVPYCNYSIFIPPPSNPILTVKAPILLRMATSMATPIAGSDDIFVMCFGWT